MVLPQLPECMVGFPEQCCCIVVSKMTTIEILKCGELSLDTVRRANADDEVAVLVVFHDINDSGELSLVLGVAWFVDCSVAWIPVPIEASVAACRHSAVDFGEAFCAGRCR